MYLVLQSNQEFCAEPSVHVCPSVVGRLLVSDDIAKHFALCHCQRVSVNNRQGCNAEAIQG